MTYRSLEASRKYVNHNVTIIGMSEKLAFTFAAMTAPNTAATNFAEPYMCCVSTSLPGEALRIMFWICVL